jgi:hypothetical protein
MIDFNDLMLNHWVNIDGFKKWLKTADFKTISDFMTYCDAEGSAELKRANPDHNAILFYQELRKIAKKQGAKLMKAGFLK